MGIGALTVIYIACKLPTWFGTMLEAGSRNQFPFDYQPALSRVIDFFEKMKRGNSDIDVVVERIKLSRGQ